MEHPNNKPLPETEEVVDLENKPELTEVIEEYRFSNFKEWKEALLKSPNAKWFKTRSLGGGKVATYVPIEIKEAVMDVMFREWYVADEKYYNVLNELICTVKIQALPDHPDSDWVSFTGSASKAIQCKKNSIPELFPKGKIANAMEYVLPASRSVAIGKAFETLGNVFGRNIQRDVKNGYKFSTDGNKTE